MDLKLLGLVGILVIVLAGFYINTGQKSNMNSNPSPTPAPESASATATSSAVPRPNGLIVEDIEVGSGKEVKSGDTIVIHYTGFLQNGTKFDSSVDRGTPFTTRIGVGEVIQGWDEGVIGMKVGGKRKLIIPPSLGYGPQQVGPIPPNSTLVFEVELLEIR